MATFAGATVSDTDALRLRGVEVAPWRPTQFRTEAPDEMVDVLIWALAEFAGEHDEDRSAFAEAKHPRNPKGSPGGGRFKSIADRVVAALADHHAGKGDGDPLKDFNREQVRKVAKARGIELPRGASEAHIKKALIDHAAPKGKTRPTPKKAPPKKLDAPSGTSRSTHLEGEAALNSVPVKAKINANNSDPSTWRATGFDGLPKADREAVAAVTKYLRSPMFTNKRLRTPDAPLHEQSIQELLGGAVDTKKAAEAAAQADRHISALDRVMDQSRLPEGIVTYRGIRLAALADLPDTAVGHSWTDPGYSSTSTDAKVAAHSFGGKGAAVLRITVPQGTPALQLGGLGESEVLLGRGLTFRVTADHGVDGTGARRLDVEAELVGGPGKPSAPSPTNTGTGSRLPLAELGKKTPVHTRQLGGGQQGDTRLLTYDDGTKVVEKILGPRTGDPPAQVRHMVDAERLGSKVLDAVGVRAPETISTGKGRLLIEHLDGRVGVELATKKREPWINSQEGRRLGLADVLMANQDRNPGNWMVLTDGHLAGIDHGEAFGAVKNWQELDSPFTRYIVEFDEGDIQFDRKEFAQIRTRLTALRPDFVEARRTGWYDAMMRRLAAIEKRLA